MVYDPENALSNRDLGILLGGAYQAFVDELNEHLITAGFPEVRASFGYVFRALADEALTQSDLAGRLGITPQGAAKLVAEMVAAGYVERRLDARDARVWRLHLAPRGKRALAAARRFHHDFEARLAAHVGKAAVKTIRRVLGTLSNDRPLRQI